MAQLALGTQQLKYEITSSLDFLSPDSLQLLAKFVTFLRSNPEQPQVDNASVTHTENSVTLDAPRRSVRMTSPRLVHRHQAADFKKEIVEYSENDSL